MQNPFLQCPRGTDLNVEIGVSALFTAQYWRNEAQRSSVGLKVAFFAFRICSHWTLSSAKSARVVSRRLATAGRLRVRKSNARGVTI